MRYTAIAILVTLGAPDLATAQTRANDPTACVNGYRSTHVVTGHGRESAGVLLRCGPLPKRGVGFANGRRRNR